MKLSKIFNLTKSKNFWLYIVFGVFLIISSILLMPIWSKINKDLFIFSKDRGQVRIEIIEICGRRLTFEVKK